MRKLLFWFLFLPVATFLALGQVKTFENFDSPDPNTFFTTSKDAVCRIDLSTETVDKKEGAAALRLRAVLPSANSWGAYTQVGLKFQNPPNDWSNNDTLSLWVKVTAPPTHPEAMSFRLQVTEENAGEQGEVWVFQNNSILDAANGWVNLKIPLLERTPTDGSLSPDSTGFCIAPANWGWPPFINKKFDAHKIATWYLTQLTIIDIADSVEVLYDDFQQTGSKAKPVIIFNGAAFPGTVTNTWAWGQSTISVEKGAGASGPQSNAIKWIQGDEWKSGWSGWGVDVKENMAAAWLKDTIKIKLKCAPNGAGVDDSLRLQIESPSGHKKGVVFDLIDDGTWHQYNFPIKDLVYTDGSTSIDSTNITVFGLMAEADAVVGRTIYVTDFWTGNPEFDVIPPAAPTGVLALGGQYKNVVTWTDVSGEPSATYDVYASEKQFASITDTLVEDIPPYKIAPLKGAAEHLLRYPLVDHDVTFYYGVTATDEAGNISAVGVSSAVTTKAKGVATIAKAPPTNIAIDGDLAEWESSGIKPIVISTVAATGQGHVEGGKVEGDVDLKVQSYLAVDANNLYFAFDVDDDVVGKTNDSIIYYTKGTYGVDGCDFFLGLYDARGMRHRGYTKGSQPDYHFRFTRFGALLDDGAGKYLDKGAASYKWVEKGLVPGYYIEGKIPFKMLADSLGGGATVFAPVEGMRIPIDYSINDNDDKNPTGQAWESREGIICYSPLNNDNAWRNAWQWTHTWIGAKPSTGVQRNTGVVATAFELSQNYPNPFNPTTNIRFSIPNAGLVSLKIYDILGREVMDVMNQYQDAGSYTVSLDASKLATGIYVYRLASGSFSSTKKMMLLK